MKNALAVYSSKSAANGRKFAEVAQNHGITLRFMGLGGTIPSNPGEICNKALTAVNGGAVLIVGAFESDSKIMDQYDQLVAAGDRRSVAAMLNDAQLPWCELYVGRFDYEKAIKANPENRPKIDGSVAQARFAQLKASKTRYVIYNQSRKKNASVFMTCLADALASETDGVVAEYQRPSK